MPGHLAISSLAVLNFLAPALACPIAAVVPRWQPARQQARQLSVTTPCSAQNFQGSDSHLRNLDPYRELGVSREASQGDIQKAYRALLFSLHPDRQQFVTDSVQTAGNMRTARRPLHGHRARAKTAVDVNKERLIRVIAAYEVLRNPEKRRRYDQAGEWRRNWNGDYVRQPMETRRRPPGYYGYQGGMHSEAGGQWSDPFPGSYTHANWTPEDTMWAPPQYIEKGTSYTIMAVYLAAIALYFAYDFQRWQAKNKYGIDLHDLAANPMLTGNTHAMTAGVLGRQRQDNAEKKDPVAQSVRPEQQVAAYLERLSRGMGGYGRPSDAKVDHSGVKLASA